LDSYSILSLLVDDHRDCVASFLGRKKIRKKKKKQNNRNHLHNNGLLMIAVRAFQLNF
jgi:hypothetical protein